MSDLTAEQLEVGRRNLLSQLRQSLRKADLSEYPVDAATMRDLVEVLEGLAPKRCPTCNGREWINGQWVYTRETVGMVCQTCGRDYAAEPVGVSDEAPSKIYYCAANQSIEQYPGGGFDVCCDRGPEGHEPIQPWVYATIRAEYAEEINARRRPARAQIERVIRKRLVDSNFNSNLHEPLRTQTIDQWADVLGGAVDLLFIGGEE